MKKENLLWIPEDELNAQEKKNIHWAKLRYYLDTQATTIWRYPIEELFSFLFAWVPTLIGVMLRLAAYKLLLQSSGTFFIEKNVSLKKIGNIRLGKSVFIDECCYIHACKNGVHIGDYSKIMRGAVLHVHNFRDEKQSGIWIGKNCYIADFALIRGQGGTRIGDNVLISPYVSIFPSNHNYKDTSKPKNQQGITSKGITIEDDVWIGANSVITDGVTIHKGAVIGAGSVVTESIPAYTIAAGNPCKVLRRIESP